MRRSALSILVFTLVVCLGTTQAWTGFSSVVSRLTDFQATGGGFKGTSGKATAEATNNALLLASLYGLRNKINTTETGKFIASLENSDGGYGPTPGSPSDVESTRNALQSLQHLDSKPSHPDKVLNYIKSLYDSNSNLFAVRSGSKGSLKGTALALQSIDALGQLNQAWLKEYLPKIKTVLNKHKPADAYYFSFPEDKESSALTNNYYGIIAGNYAGFDFGAGKQWAKYITDLQSGTGQFYDSVEKKGTSLASTAHAMLSLSALGTLKGAEKFVDAVNVESLKKGVRHIAADVASAAHAHSAVALTKAFKNFFKTVVNYDGSENEYITEGSKFSPSVAVHSVFDDNTEYPHGGFDVDTTTTFHGKDAHKSKLSWDATLQRYTGLSLATLGNLGPVKFAAKLAHKVAGLGPLDFDIDLSKSIGYGLTVVPKVSQEGGRDIREGEVVSQGTDFKFTVSLNTFSDSNLQSGDFVVAFSVLDSSNVLVHQSSVDGATNNGPISFTYKLSDSNLPAGTLSFRFDVSGKGSNAPHTTKTLKYNYVVSLVASNINISGKTAKLGDKVKVTMEPAAFPDLRNTHALATKDAHGNDATGSRKFFLDLKSPQGTLVRSVPSHSTAGSAKYTFDVNIEPLLDNIGTHVLSFRYVPSVGEEIVLQNFDSASGELQEDTNALSFTVKSSLSVADLNAPKAGNLFYGGNVGYKFRLKDDESGQYVYSSSEKPLSNVFLDLAHEGEKGSRPYTSVHHPASVSGEGKDKRFTIDWTVNPNAVSGAGSFGLSVVDVDGNPIAVKGSTPVKVNVGGNIDVTPNVYTTSIQTSLYTALVAEFTLSCQGKQLKDADLLVNVVRDGHVVATLPVAHNNGKYEVTLAGTHKEVPSASYKFDFFRVADRKRAQEAREQRLKRERKERELRGDVPVTAEDESYGVEPLFSVDVPYSAPKLTSLPVRAEFLSVVLLGGLFAYLQLKKNALTKTN